MAISDADFAAWLLRRTRRVVLGELKFGYEVGGAPAEGTFYAASGKYATTASESPASQSYRDVIIETPSFKRELDVQSLGGQSKYSVSDLKLADADGAIDFLADKVIDGREGKFYLGDPDWPRSDFRLVLVTVSERVMGDQRETVVKLRDKRLLLDREIKGNPVGGSGPNASKYLPLLWGSHQNLDLQSMVYDTTANEYSVLSNYSVSFTAIVDVRDAGKSLNSGTLFSAIGANGFSVNDVTDVFTKVAHGFSVNDVIWWEFGAAYSLPKNYNGPFGDMPARPFWVSTVPSPDTFTLSLTRGGATLNVTGTLFNNLGTPQRVVRARYYDDTQNTGRIQLSADPTGRVTCDVYNYPVGYVDDAPFALAKTLISTYGNVTAAEIDSAAFTAADTALDLKVSLGFTNLAVLDRQNLLNVLDMLIDSCFGWYGADNLGVITCGLIDPSGLATATATRTLTEGEIIDGLSYENLAPTTSRVNVNYQINITVQTDGLLTTVTPSDRTKYGAPFGAVQRSTAPSGTAYSTNKPLYHKTMTEAAPRIAASMNTTAYGTQITLPIGNYADEIVEDLRPNLRVLRCKTGIDKYAWKLGDVVTITHSRFGMSAGKKCRLVEIGVDLRGETVELGLLTYVAPDVITASHP